MHFEADKNETTESIGEKLYLLLDQIYPKKYLQIHLVSSIPKMVLNAMLGIQEVIFLQIVTPKMIAWENAVGPLKSSQSFKPFDSIQSKIHLKREGASPQALKRQENSSSRGAFSMTPKTHWL